MRGRFCHSTRLRGCKDTYRPAEVWLFLHYSIFDGLVMASGQCCVKLDGGIRDEMMCKHETLF